MIMTDPATAIRSTTNITAAASPASPPPGFTNHTATTTITSPLSRESWNHPPNNYSNSNSAANNAPTSNQQHHHYLDGMLTNNNNGGGGMALLLSTSSSKDDFFLHHYSTTSTNAIENGDSHRHHASPSTNTEDEFVTEGIGTRNINHSYHGHGTSFTIEPIRSNNSNGNLMDGNTQGSERSSSYNNFFFDDTNTDAIIGTQLLESMNQTETVSRSTELAATHNPTEDHRMNTTSDNDASHQQSHTKISTSFLSHEASVPPQDAPQDDGNLITTNTMVVGRSDTATTGDSTTAAALAAAVASTVSNGRNGNVSTNTTNDHDSLSYHRMKRHLASRLIGTATSTATNTTPSTNTNSTNHPRSHSPVPSTMNIMTKPSTLLEALNSSSTSGAPLLPPQLRSSVSNPAASSMVFENLKHQQQLPSSLNYDSNAIVSDNFYHTNNDYPNISSNESAISAPSKIMHPVSTPTKQENTNDMHNDVTNPRLFTTWSSFGTPTSQPLPSSHHQQPRSTTPVQLYAGQQSAIGQPRRSLPRTKDIGMNIIEPNVNDNDSTSNSNVIITTSENIQSHRIHTTSAANHHHHHHHHSQDNQNDGTITSDTTTSVGTMMNRSIQELERGIQNLWSPEAHEFQQEPSPPSVPPVVNHHHQVPHPHAPPLVSNQFYHPNSGPSSTPSYLQAHQPPPSNYVATSNSSYGGGGGPPSGNSSISDPVTTYSSELTPHQVEIDLQPYCWDSTLSSKFGVSRTLVLLHVSQHYIRISDVRTACETFGVLESFRADFVTKFGIYFISYYDIRSAQYASVELQSILQRISVMSRSNEEVVVHFCLSLNSSSPYDESQIVINNLPATHHHMNESTILSMLSSYGAVRSIQFLNNDDINGSGTNSCLVEFQNIQDTKQALLELDNSQPFIGNGGMFSSNNVITVQVKPRDENERRRGRDLLALLSRWRHSNNQSNGIGLQQQQLNYRGIVPNVPSAPSVGQQQHYPASYNAMNGTALPFNKFSPSGIDFGDGNGFGSGPVGGAHINSNTSRNMIRQPLPGVPSSADPWFRDSTTSTTQLHESARSGQPQSVPQYVLGPDGRYTQSHPQKVNSAPYDFGTSVNHSAMDRQQQQSHSQQRSNGGQLYPPPYQPSSANHRYSSDRSVSPHQPSMQQHHSLAFSGRNHHQDARSINSTNGTMTNHHHHTPYYAHTITPTDSNSILGRSLRSGSGHSHMTPGGQSHGTSVGNTSAIDNNLMMDLDLVEIGQDTRTSLMVRNIPNKYTQQMLLSEFDSNGHGPGIIDFFYLPIDFKNRCNRGYAFINFVNYKDILGFHRRYFGKHWRTFNSDKICDITYARIQGKDAMLKRFENSALMEKDDEYKPLVFASDGPNRGTRLPFPDPMNIQQMNHHQQHGHNSSSSSSNHHHLQPQSYRHQINQHPNNTIFNTTSSTASMDSRTEM